MKAPLKLTGDKILVKLDKPEETTASGLVIPPSAANSPNTGVIIDLGDNVNELDKGDLILFKKRAGVDYHIEGEHHVIIKEDDAIAKIKNS